MYISSNNTSSINNLLRDKNTLFFTANVLQTNYLELPLIHYIGYKATLDGKDLDIYESKNGLVEITIDKSGLVKVWYAGTKLQKISLIITSIGFFLLGGYIIINKRNERKLSHN